jgi:hypothetical protein
VRGRRRTAQELAQSDAVPPLAKHGEIGGGHNKDRPDNVSSGQHGNSAAYLVAKLKRDAPEFAERVGQLNVVLRSTRCRIQALTNGFIPPFNEVGLLPELLVNRG